MNTVDFFKKAIANEISSIELSSQNQDAIVQKYTEKYLRNQFNGRPLNLLGEVKVEAKKLKKMEGSK